MLGAVVLVAEIFSPEILIPIVLVAVLFGSAKIPEFARSLGSARREFDRGARGDAEPTEE
jgi:TatA/E family protein of Tat protein translocase